ncbi:MAG: ribosome biogenesis GTPase Der [Candidatus Cardinium sp.]|uniref:ribosome biogenesis GTPase Der n=1 Tax=Candidatus Cardinium sp. TP TaxID=2961955 RepID=UPI0021AFAB5B|nr:ribosome biogenesis GTPase Der [Candidatus Cardinium sp. TP]MCT4697025.1 ribosome biogenesis GTPase Der [Candidatus Cardinium sp. TP]MDN5246919.1 ribosome biogenesis GTPase Der [Candidatus Cardinium sp.]
MANVVALVGRSNVGKSTFFNRLIESRKAIMDGSVHTTRDRHYGYAQWGNRSFTVIDTGGYMCGTGHTFEHGIREQIQLALDEANLVLFMVDCLEGLTDADKDFAHLLRKINKPIFLVANKSESVMAAMVAPSFYALGLGTPFPIAAINGSGTGDLLDALLPYLKETSAIDAGPDQLPRFTILGRPNVGKSSFLNVLLDEKRSMVSPISGTTRDAIDTEYNRYNKKFILTDTAGIRKKSKVKDAIEFYSVLRAVKSMQDADICLIMIDAQHGIEAQDISLIALAHRYKKGMALVVNKWDLMDKEVTTAEAYRKHLLRKLAPLDYLPILFVSTVKKQRVYQTIEKALSVYQNKIKKIPTSELNKVLLPIIENNHPPAVKGKYIQIKYCTQVTAHAPTFAFFCNHPAYIQPNYKSYLVNQLRAHFNFEGVPVQVVFKKK